MTEATPQAAGIGWMETVAECYYFDGNGYMAANTTTPDGYTVDGSGAWVVDGVVQTQTSQSQAAQGQTSDGAPEKYPLRTTLVKEKYVNLLNKSVDEMFRVMGEREMIYSALCSTHMYFRNMKIPFSHSGRMMERCLQSDLLMDIIWHY